MKAMRARSGFGFGKMEVTAPLNGDKNNSGSNVDICRFIDFSLEIIIRA